MSMVLDRVRDVIVVILGGGRGARLDPLTRLRSKPAVPIAGKHRLIDIPISNAINSGMERMFLLTQFNSISLHRHIVRTYKFDFFTKGFVQILAAQQTPAADRWFQGTADAVRQNLRIILETGGDLVLILAGDHMYRMDYRDMLLDHLEHGAEITLSVIPCSAAEIGRFGAVRVDETGQVVEFREKPRDAEARAGLEAAPELRDKWRMGADCPYLGSMGIYLFDKRVLAQCLDNDFDDFGHHVIPFAAPAHRVFAHRFDGYWRDIGTIRAFYDMHMDLVRDDSPFNLSDPHWPFYTHPRYLPAARLDGARFVRSLLAEGSVIIDSGIEDSIIGVRSRVVGATIRRSLIMGADPAPPAAPAGAPPQGIGEGAVIENAIVDKNARIGRGVKVTNPHRLVEADGPGWTIREGIPVIPKNAVIPDGTVI